ERAGYSLVTISFDGSLNGFQYLEKQKPTKNQRVIVA
ncbi:MAG: hypothetical protein ACI9SX_001158, partial [Pseudoalteromonas tetraodonis]